jgi:hypothetical protein
MFVSNKFPAFHCRTIAFKARKFAFKSRIKFRLKFVQDLTAKLTLSLFFATGLFRLLSTNIENRPKCHQLIAVQFVSAQGCTAGVHLNLSLNSLSQRRCPAHSNL